MRTLSIFFGLLLMSSVWAQDCFFCGPSLSLLPIQVPEWPIEYTAIAKVNYKRNTEASFCKRPVEMVDTIVLHHSETPSTDSPEKINEYHLSRGTKDDPWYMIAYSYVINSPYAGERAPAARVSEGRPLDLVGAHAGSGIMVPMDAFQKKLWADGKIICGKEGEEFKVNPKYESNGKIAANVSTVGLVVIGNYSPFAKDNPTGYKKTKPRYPTKTTQDLIAKMSCQLQKKYPRMKNIKWHSYYHPTSCPGTIKQYLGQIKALARNYGCEFN